MINSYKYLQRSITVDPGFSGTTKDGTGWAYWNGSKFPTTGLIKEIKKKKKILSIEERIENLFFHFASILTLYQPKKLIIESMAVWAISPTSMSSATSGKLMNLQALVGGYCAMAFSQGVNFKMILPAKWKGQLNKEAVIKRIYRINKTTYPNHISDAVGIGFSMSGHL